LTGGAGLDDDATRPLRTSASGMVHWFRNIERANLTRVPGRERAWWLKENSTMSEQFENQNATKSKVDTVSETKTEKKVNQVAEVAAEKAVKIEQHYDKDHNIFSK
jgi:hypothetical protein